MKTYVQYGCGFDAPDGWINYDASPTLFFERIPVLGRLYTKNEKRFPKNVMWGDIVRGLPHGAGTVDGIFCSHILEHLSLEDCRRALRNTHQYLKEGGIFRLVLPDLEFAVRQYEGDPSPEAARRFMETTLFGVAERPSFLKRIAENVLGNSKHLWMWDEKALAAELSAVGFQKIRRAKFGDSHDQKFQEVENRERFLNCLALEAVK